MMKNCVLIFLIALTFCSCTTFQTPETTANAPKPTSTIKIENDNGKEIGYPRFTSSDKQYLGCWRSVEASEVVGYKLIFAQFWKKSFQTSEMSEQIDYDETESNNHKDYFILKAKSHKNDDTQPYLSINMASDDEMTVHGFATKEAITDGEGITYWNLKREKCENITLNFK